LGDGGVVLLVGALPMWKLGLSNVREQLMTSRYLTYTSDAISEIFGSKTE